VQSLGASERTKLLYRIAGEKAILFCLVLGGGYGTCPYRSGYADEPGADTPEKWSVVPLPAPDMVRGRDLQTVQEFLDSPAGFENMHLLVPGLPQKFVIAGAV